MGRAERTGDVVCGPSWSHASGTRPRAPGARGCFALCAGDGRGTYLSGELMFQRRMVMS